MVERLTGAAIASVVILGYLILVQVMMAACVLLAQFLVLQLRVLRTVIGSPQSQAVQMQASEEPPRQTYRLGGDLRW